MMSAKLGLLSAATLGLLKMKVFWNKDYDVIIFVYDVTNKILLRNPNCIVEVIICSMFGNSSISMREVIITSIF